MNRRVSIQACLNIKERPYLIDTHSKNSYECVSSGRVPAWQMQNLEFKAQYTPPKIKQNKRRNYNTS
jgi:hypothetical protein